MFSRKLTRRHFLALGGGALLAPALSGNPAARAATARPGAVDFSMPLSEAAFGGVRASGRRRVTDAIDAPARFDLIGLRWSGAFAARIDVRTRRRDGRWSDWVRLPDAAGHGPDGVRTGGTEPAWSGGADQFQLRFDRRVKNVRVHFVNSTGTVTAAGRARARLRKAVAPARRALDQALASRRDGRPRIITRSEWGGDSLPPKNKPEYGEVKLAFVHHTVNTNDYDRDESAAMVLAIAKYHRNTNGWGDIGYNFLVDKYGQIFEGRAGGVERAVVGAQAAGVNSVSTGISHLGTYSTVKQTSAAIEACAALIAWKLGLHGVPVIGTVRTNGRTFERISGHRDANSTACPGDALYAQLPKIRELAQQGGGGPAPARGSLTFDANRTELSASQSALLAGVVTLADGSKPSGVPVELQIQGSKGYRTFARTRTSSDGRWSFRFKRSASARLRARIRDTSNRRRVYSESIKLLIAPVVRASVSSARVANRSSVTVRGRVRPAKRSVVVELERRGADGSYRRAGNVRLAARGGRFSGPVRFRRPGRYRLTVRSPADSRNATGRSAAMAVRVGGGASRRTGGSGA